MKTPFQQAIDAIHADQCVVFPTETVYGLGANALSAKAVSRIFQLKNRPKGNPLITHVPDIDSILSVATEISPLENLLLQTFSPGPLSLILPKKNTVPNITSGGLNTIGVRIPDHPIALDFLKAVNVPISAPSANISGKPSPTTFAMAQFYMQDKAIILDGGDLDLGIESTVVKVVKDKIYILRSGHITAEMIQNKLDRPVFYPHENLHESPGTRFAHYQPNAKVILFEANNPPHFTENSAVLSLNQNTVVPTNSKLWSFISILEYAHHLYAVFFECDQMGIDTIYCEIPPTVHQGIALKDRLFRASSRLN